MDRILYEIPDLKAELVRLIDLEQQSGRHASTKIRQRFSNGRVDGLEQALRLADVAERSRAVGHPVGMRQAETITKEVEENARSSA